MVQPSEQSVWLFYKISGAVNQEKVKLSQVKRSAGLAVVKFLSCYEILQVLVVSLYLHWMSCSFQEISLLF